MTESRPVSFVLAATAHGMMIVPRHDMVEVEGGAYGVGGQILTLGGYEQKEIEQIKALLSLRRERFGDDVVMIDCGANIGAVTIDCARHMYDWGIVYGFEPQERLYYALAGNVAMNNLHNARVFLTALGREEGGIDVPVLDYCRSGSYGSLELRGENGDLGQEISDDVPRCKVQLETIDNICETMPRVDFIKIDVEGMECDVLTGAANTIERCQPILWVEHVKSEASELAAVLAEFGYRSIPAGMNLLCVPKDADYVRQGTEMDGFTPGPLMPASDATELEHVFKVGEEGRTAEAMDLMSATKAFNDEKHPLHHVAIFNMGTLRMQAGWMQDAITYYNEVIANGPKEFHDLAKFSRGFSNLVLGNLRLGFEDFEYRKKGEVPQALAKLPKLTAQHVYPGMLSRLEDGQIVTDKPLTGRKVLVLGEMGFGDNIMFARYLKNIADQGGTPIVSVPPQLQTLFACLPHIQVHGKHSPEPDYWCHMMSLAHIFRTNIDSVPPPAEFILPEAQLARWKAPMLSLSAAGRLKVGLCWSGSRKSQYDKHRSIPLHELGSVLMLPGVDFYSLQLDVRDSDRDFYDSADIFGLGDKVFSFLDTACAIKGLDLVITVDTSVAHLAGSLGVPTWVMLTKFRTYWAWIQGRTDSPWYPSMRAVMQDTDGDWSGIVDKLIGYLTDVQEQRASQIQVQQPAQ